MSAARTDFAGPYGAEVGGVRLTDAERAALFGAATLMVLAPDAIVYQEGDAAAALYVIAQGTVRASRLLPDGRRQLVAFLWQDEVFGLAQDRRYLNTLETVTPVTLHRLPVTAVETVLRSDARLALELAVRTAHELRAAQGHILCLGQLDVPRRVARFLLDCAQHAVLFDAATGTLALPMRRQDIADYLGASVEAVARAFTRLEGQGLIRRIAPRQIAIGDRLRLERFAERQHAAR